MKSPKMSRHAARQILLEAYQQSSGIFDHLKHARMMNGLTKEGKLEKARPLASIAKHRAEALPSKSIMQDHFAEYRSADVLKYSGVTWDQYLLLEPRQARMLVTLGRMERDDEKIRRDEADRKIREDMEQQRQNHSAQNRA